MTQLHPDTRFVEVFEAFQHARRIPITPIGINEPRVVGT
jgi:hypothetical protein